MPPGGQRTIGRHVVILLCAACTECIIADTAQYETVELCLGAACTECIHGTNPHRKGDETLPRRCLHGVHRLYRTARRARWIFASALPARSASLPFLLLFQLLRALPRRCLHGVHRQKPTNCGTPFCSIRRESVDSFSEINNKDSCADYFPALFCCQGDLHHHYRQPRTGNRPVLRCEQHRLFLFILSSHYRRLL